MEDSKNLCFACSDFVDPPLIGNEDIKSPFQNSFRSKTSSQFFSFAQRYLQLITTDWCRDTNLHVFCEACSAKVKNICELYDELCEVELRLSSKLEEFGRLMQQPQENAFSKTDNLNTLGKVDVNVIRKFVASKCLEKLKNAGAKKSGSNFEDKTPNPVQEMDLVENDDVHCVKLDPYELEYIYVEDDAVQDGESFMGPEHDPLSTSSPISNINRDVRDTEYSSIIAEQNDNGRELGATGKFAETFSKLYHKVCKLRRDSDNESEYGSDDDEKDWEPGSDARWDSRSESSDDSENTEESGSEQPRTKKLRHEISQAGKKVTATIASSRNALTCDECKRPFSTADNLYCHLMWHEKQSGKQKASISCYFCYKSFSFKQSQQLHIQIKHPYIIVTKNPFKCDDKECGASFGNFPDLDIHLATHSKPIHKCSVCNWRFVNAENLKVHQVFHTPNNNGFQCPSCTLITRNVKNLVTHYNRKHGPGVGIIKDFTCPECGADFAHKAYLKKHMKMMNHSYGEEGEPVNVKYHFCPHCNERFFYKHSLIKHISKECAKNPEIKVVSCIRTKSRSGKLVKKLPCHVCGKLVIKVNMKKHLETHRPETEKEQTRVICDICGTSCGSKKVLKNHVDRVHKGIKKEKVQCTECPKMFCSQWFLNKHIDMVHKGMDLSVICDVCGKVLKSRMNLLAHLKTHAEQKPHACHLCSKRFGDKGTTLRKHLIREHGKTKGEEFTPGEGVVFKCACMFPSCTATFVTDIELQSHVEQSHSQAGEKFMCSLCGRIFVNQPRLTRHNLVHSGEKPHTCTVCSRSFQYRTSLKEHLQAVHSIGKEQECFPCNQPDCERKFKIRKHLQRHLRQFHGFTLGKATTVNIKEEQC